MVSRFETERGMSTIGTITNTMPGSSGPPPRRGRAEPKDNAAPSRALVALAPVAAPAREAGTAYRPAAFLAQLIATKGQCPQTRERRRAEPDEVMHSYAAALADKPLANGRHFSRTI